MKLEITGGGGDTSTLLNLQKRIALIKPYVTPDATVLDIGCGRGDYVFAFSAFSQARGIESDEDKVADFQLKHPNHKNLVDLGSAEKLPYGSDSIDVIVVNEVLEHIPDQEQALREIYRVLKPAGRFLLFCPNRLYPFESHGMKRKDGTTSSPWIPFIPYIPMKLLPFIGLRPWARNYWPWEINQILKNHGFQILAKEYVAQTFEGISGTQPVKLAHLRPILRKIFSNSQQIPILSGFMSVSQLLVCATADKYRSKLV